MNYTLNQLQVFLKVVQTGSVTRAAEELHLSQPAVSIQLRNLQDQFDIPLTENVGRRIHITDFGREIALAAEEILEQVHAIQSKTMAYKGLLTGRLKISVVSTGKYILPYYLSGFMQQHAGVELVMDVTNRQKVVLSLENNELDFALLSILPTSFGTEHVELLDNKLFLVGGGGTVDGGSEQVPIGGGSLPLILRESGSGTRLIMEDYLKQMDMRPGKRLELTSNEAVKQAVIAGLGYSLMPLIGLKHELQSGEVAIIPSPGLPIYTKWCLVWLRGKRHSPVAQAYLDYLHREKDAITQSRFDWYQRY
ncbi:MAG: LysR family transcriptional regulator [Bacteroidia bacterium]